MRHLNFDSYPSRNRGGPWVTLVATYATMRMSLIFKCPIISIVSELSRFWGVSTIKWNSYPILYSSSRWSRSLFVLSWWETAKLCPKMDLRNLWIRSYFVLFLFIRWPTFPNFLSRSEVHQPRVLYIVCMFINRQLFISRDIQSCDCIFGFHRKE